MATIRYFAAAAAAAGMATEQRDADTLGELLRDLTAAHGSDFDRVLARCSVLVDGRVTADPGTVVTGSTAVDILPPFAGG